MLHVGTLRFSGFLFGRARAVKAVVTGRALGLETQPWGSSGAHEALGCIPGAEGVRGWVGVVEK